MSQKFFRKNVTFWSSLGASLEYYDFIIFLYLAPTLSMVFFDDGTSSALIKTYMLSSIAYFARPIGSLIYGMVGDVKGRYKTFLGIMYTMALSTFAIALLPSFKTIGLAAPILLLFFRIFQGISFGAELPGAIIVVCEHKNDQQKARASSIVISSVTLGSIFACLVSFALTKTYTQEAIVDWAWRLPFLLGGVLGFVNLWIRKNLSETPVFLSTQKQQSHKTLWSPLKEILKSYKSSLVLGTVLGLASACLVVTYTYFPRLFPKFYGYNPQDVYWHITVGLLWSALLVPILGRIADRIGHGLIFSWTSIFALAFMIPLFSLPEKGDLFLLLFFIGFQTILCGLVVTTFPILVKLFPPQVRFTGVAVCYNITYALVSTLPAVFVSLLEYPPTLLIKIILSLIGASFVAWIAISAQMRSVDKQ
jgi:MFS family permease